MDNYEAAAAIIEKALFEQHPEATHPYFSDGWNSCLKACIEALRKAGEASCKS